MTREVIVTALRCVSLELEMGVSPGETEVLLYINMDPKCVCP
jgi:hypothetical protein